MKPVRDMFVSFKGIRNEHVGARLIDMPERQIATPRGQSVEIPGRDGILWLPDGDSYDPITIKVSFAIPDPSDEFAVLDWLSGMGDLVLGDAPEFFYPYSRVITSAKLNRITPRLAGKRLTVTFTCAPFRRLLDEEPLTFTEAAVFSGQGSKRSRPEITVYGNGDINLMVNGSTVLLSDVDDHITLDCEAMMAFKDGVNASPQVTLLGGEENDVYSDDWPSLRPAGETNRISWSDDGGDGSTVLNTTRVVVQPKWRWR